MTELRRPRSRHVSLAGLGGALVVVCCAAGPAIVGLAGGLGLAAVLGVSGAVLAAVAVAAAAAIAVRARRRACPPTTRKERP